MDMSNIVVEVEEDTKDCFFFLAALARLAVAVWLGTGIGMDSVLLRGKDWPPMITSAFLESTAAFRPAALRMILAVFAAAAMMIIMVMMMH
jgi:hypothetical protein